MSANCFSCNKEVHVTKQIKCDYCKEIFHPDCTNLTRAEINLLKSQERSLKFSCETCKNLPPLLTLIKELQQAVTTLTSEINSLKENKSATTEESVIIQKVIGEINEREKRSSNIIIFNCVEEENVTDDIKVNELLSTLSNDLETSYLKSERLGKIVDGKIRPIKVSLKSKEDVVAVLKNKKRIGHRFKNVRISSDQTIVQRQYFKLVKEEAEKRKQNGENVVIKFFSGVPVIKKSI